MIPWLLVRTLRHSPGRLALGALGVAFPVAIFAASLMFMNLAVHTMTQVTLEPIKLEQRALATSLNSQLVAKVRRPACVSRWHFAQRRTHFASSASIRTQLRRIPSAEIAKSFVRESV